MQSLNLGSLSTFFKNYRTHLSSAAAILSALAGLAGVLPSTTSQSLAVAFAGLAAICVRLTQTDHALTLAEALQALKDAHATIEQVFAVQVAAQQQAATTMDLQRQLETVGNQARGGGGSVTNSTTTTSTTTGLLLLAAGIVISGAAGSWAQDRPDLPKVLTSMQLSTDTRSWFRNPDGSCVQCSIGMAGVHTNNLNAASLLWDTDYGPAVRGGSWPSRVEQYCDQRGIKAWSVTGKTVDETMPWMLWAARTGRFAAIGAGSAHFQTLYGYDPAAEKPWLVCNNNSPQRIDRYGDREFRQLHAASGPWVVILEKPSSDPPTPTKWWK